MSVPSQEEVQRMLEPYHSRIRYVVELAWDEWKAIVRLKQAEGISPCLYSRTVANNIFDAIAKHAINEFASDDSVKVRFEAQTVKFFFTAGVFGRFKKGDSNKLGRNIATQAAMNFMDADGTFDDLPPETAKVEFIWIANEIQTSLESVYVIARDGNRLLWEYEIEPIDNVISLPEPIATQADVDDTESLVTPKRNNEIQSGSDEG